MGEKVKGLYGSEVPESAFADHQADYAGPVPIPREVRQQQPQAMDPRMLLLLTEIRDDARAHHRRMRGLVAIALFFFLVGGVVIVAV